MAAVDRGSWIPREPWKSAYIPDNLVTSFKKLHPYKDQLHPGNAFCILVDYFHNDEYGHPIFHLSFCDSTPKWKTQIVSLCRTKKILPLAVLCDRCLQYPELFSMESILTHQKSESILRGLCHPLWTSFHIVTCRLENIHLSEYDAMNAYLSAHMRHGEAPSDNSAHFAAIRNNLDLLVTSVAYSNSINYQDRYGNTVLHIAVVWSNLLAVQFLLCRGVDPNITNSSGQSALHLASQMKANVMRLTKCSSISDHRRRENDRCLIVKALLIAGAHKCDPNFLGCTGDCIAEGRKTIVFFHREKMPVLQPETSRGLKDQLNQTKSIRHVLSTLQKFRDQGKTSNVITAFSLDGGGIKGICLIQLLLAIEKRLDGQLIDYIDWIGGTSTGAIIAAALGRGFPLRKIQRLYIQLKDKVFQPLPQSILLQPLIRASSSAVLESFLKEELGVKTTLADIKYPKMFFTTLNAKETPCKLVLQRTYRLPGSNKLNRELEFSNPKEHRLWKAVRRSTAAPVYFKVVDGKYIDGGVGANNPSSNLLAEYHKHNRLLQQTGNKETLKMGCLVSLGCGAPPPCKVSFKKKHLPYAHSRIFVDRVCETDDTSVDNTRESCFASQVPFFRLTPKLTEDIDLATKDNVKVIGLMWNAFVYTKANSGMIDQIADLLKEIGTNEERAQLFGNHNGPRSENSL